MDQIRRFSGWRGTRREGARAIDFDRASRAPTLSRITKPHHPFCYQLDVSISFTSHTSFIIVMLSLVRLSPSPHLTFNTTQHVYVCLPRTWSESCVKIRPLP